MTLDDDVAWTLAAFPRELADLGSPGLDTLTAIVNLRQKLALFARAAQPRPEGIGAVRDYEVPGPAGAPAVPVRVLWPTTAGPRQPAVLHLHGGGFTIGSIASQEPLARRITAATGCVSVIVDYRLAPEHPYPAAPDDCYAALCWLADNAADLGVDRDRIAVAGDSAGGNLATVMGLKSRDLAGPPIAFQLLLYPVTGDSDTYPSYTDPDCQTRMLTSQSASFYRRQYLPDEVTIGEPAYYATPARAPSLAGLPPAFIATAGHDPLRDDGEHYARRLAEDGVPVTLRRYPTMPHGFITLASMVPAAARALDDIIDFLCGALRIAPRGPEPTRPEPTDSESTGPEPTRPGREPSARRRLQQVGGTGRRGAGAVLGDSQGDGEASGQAQA